MSTKKTTQKRKTKRKSPPKKAHLRGKTKTRKRRSKKLITEEQIQKVINKGKERGFVTNAELLHIIPKVEDDISGLENVYERLREINIRVVESVEFLDLPNSVRKKPVEKKTPLRLESFDNVQMYLREIGRVPLINAQEEVRLAKKIERGDDEARQK